MIVWEDLLSLHAIRRLSDIIRRRWNLGIGFADANGEPVLVPEARRFRTVRSLCLLVQSNHEGLAGCKNVGFAVTRLLRERAHPDEQTLPVVSSPFRCHARLHEIAMPIIIDGETLGSVYTGGFFSGERLDDERDETTQRLEIYGMDRASVHAAIAGMPVLSETERAYLKELVELVVEEMVVFQSEITRREKRLDQLQKELITRYSYDAIIGKSRPMQELYRILDKVIDSDSTVLVQGENGTGKELIARAIHFNSRRKDKPFVVQNCSAFNDNLLDSELFGHRRGAFTGAISDKKGLFEVADGGTFFLDEIGDMSPALQVKLLRVLQEGTFTAVGDTSPRRVDVRIIAATNRDLKRMVERGEYREDLYYRINVINITVPTLRERREDVPLLIEHFMKQNAHGRRLVGRKISKRAVEKLYDYSWPGNIRELENEIERLVVLAGDERLIGEDLLSPRIRQQMLRDGTVGQKEPTSLPEALETLERTMIYEGLKKTHWNKTKTAQELGISRRNLIRKVNKYKLDQRRVRA